MDCPPNPNPNPNFNGGCVSEFIDTSEFEFSDFLMLQDGLEDEFSSQNVVSSDNVSGGGSSIEFAGTETSTGNCNIKYKNGVKKNKVEAERRVAFRTKSELEVMDDGFKWRKYGKKKVKNSPNPRNYYKCASEGCRVKKKVERDRDDPSYVITTYDGVHNHESPCVIYYNQMPLKIPHG